VHWWGRQDPHGARQLKKRKVINWVQPYKEVHCDTTQSYLPPQIDLISILEPKMIFMLPELNFDAFLCMISLLISCV
jgi:hypothetical protein